MNNLYIKHPEGYCFLEKKTQTLYFLSLMDYLVKHNSITDESIVASFKKMKELFYDVQNNSFTFSYIDYVVSAQKSFSNTKDIISLGEVEESYATVTTLHSLSTHVIDYLTSLDKKIKAITNIAFKDYLDILAEKKYYDKKEDALTKNFYNQGHDYFDCKKATEVEMLKIKKEYPNASVVKTHTEYKKALKFNLQELIDKWKLVLDENGHVKSSETNSATDHFKKSVSYAIFCEVAGSTGYFQSKAWGMAKISSLNEAKMFYSIDDAKVEMNKCSLRGAIVSVDVNFKEVVHQVGNIDLSHLETVVAYQEKEKIEYSIDNTDAKALAKQLLSLVSHNEGLSDELNKLLVEKEESNQKKIKRKI